MAGLLNTLRQMPDNEIALDAQGANHHERIFGGRPLKGAQTPPGVGAVFREGTAV
jgi:hypothetical protein